MLPRLIRFWHLVYPASFPARAHIGRTEALRRDRLFVAPPPLPRREDVVPLYPFLGTLVHFLRVGLEDEAFARSEGAHVDQRVIAPRQPLQIMMHVALRARLDTR